MKFQIEVLCLVTPPELCYPTANTSQHHNVEELDCNFLRSSMSNILTRWSSGIFQLIHHDWCLCKQV